MRKIKFRAWSKELGIFYPSSIEWCNGGLSVDDYDPPEFVGESLVLMQYTGLKDKNGKEIYEGDILKSKYGYDNIQYLFHGPVCIGEKDGRYMVYADDVLLMEEFNQCEVAGNIYEHPELLK